MKELIDQLTSGLGINSYQAEGGAAVLLKAARDKLGAAEFENQLGGLPGLNDLLTKVPAAGGGLGGMLGSLMGGNAALIASVVGGFGKLGLKPDDAKRFVPIILVFLRTRVGPDVVSRLEITLRA